MAHEPVRTHLVPEDRLVRTRGRTGLHEEHIDVGALASDLRTHLEGEVRFDDGSRAMYAVDASNYRQIPIGVIVPRSRDDAIEVIAICRRHGAPIVSRAGGTGLAGQTCNAAVVLDWSKFVNRIVELNPSERFARVEPGVVCDQLAHVSKAFGLTWGPQPATHSHCCFGGMLGNNSCGVHAQMAGKAVDNTEALEVLLYDGTRMHLGWMTEADLEAAVRREGREGDVYRRIVALRDQHAALIRERFPKLPRRVSGYNLDQLLAGDDGRINVARALVGSEGTLVTILEAKVRLVDDPPERVLVVLGYPSVFDAADQVPDVLAFDPIGLEGMDDGLRRNVIAKGGERARYVRGLPKGLGWLFVEFGAKTKDEALDRANKLLSALHDSPTPPEDARVVEDHEEQERLWKVREAGLGASAIVPGRRDAWAGWEDSAVRPDRLGGYLRELTALFDRYNFHPALYGHFGMGCIHCRVPFDLESTEGVRRYRSFVEHAADLVARYEGSLSGEHGDGQSRAELLPRMFGERVVQLFGRFKSIWDPDGMMNPGKIVDPYRLDENLRLGPSYHPNEPDTHFRYPSDHGSFAHATLRCVGIGNCRRLEGSGTHDTMCPSYMVTREEKHSTRGRAHLLHEMLVEGPIHGGWRDENVKEALDLCLSCKGCRGDCPVNVDVATYKAEFLSHYYEGRLRPRHAYAFGLVDVVAQLASAAPGLANLGTQTPGLSAIAKFIAGMSQQRAIPAFAPETFRSWFQRRGAKHLTGERVILWADTFNNHFTPEPAKAAVEILEELGAHVVVPDQHLCCGRPLYDYGMLDRAKVYLERVLFALRDDIAKGTPIVVLEPSCASVFRTELLDLFPDREDAARLASSVKLLSEWLVERDYTPPRMNAKAIGQGHCHHKSVLGFDDERSVLDAMGLDFTLLESGCCGMAGAFGYERGEKYRVSIDAGERVLLPKVRAAEPTTLVVADGFSCREQIRQTTRRQALHLAQVLVLAKRGFAGGHSPKRVFVVERERATRAQMRRTAGVMLLAGAAIATAVWMLRRRRQ